MILINHDKCEHLSMLRLCNALVEFVVFAKI